MTHSPFHGCRQLHQDPSLSRPCAPLAAALDQSPHLNHWQASSRLAPHARTRHPRRLPLLLLTLLVLDQSGRSQQALAALPLPTYPQCGPQAEDTPSLCPSDLGEDWRFISYIKNDYIDQVRPEEWPLGSGIWLDKAFSLETGSFQVTIAVMDSGIEWEYSDLLNKHRLNTSELPLPQNATRQTAASHDLNGDGLVNIQDYAQDPRVALTAGDDAADGVLDPSDLIAVFSDGIDQDSNGYTDDISGWDFFWNDNNPYDTVRNGHGTFEAKASAREGGNDPFSAGESKIGTCPNCSVLNLRVGDSYVTDANVFAEAVLYAADNQVQIIQEALGAINSSSFTMQALAYANQKGVTIIASMADETSIHQNQPANNEGVITVHGIRYNSGDEIDAETFLAFENCTNFGGNLDLSVSGTDCSSEATARSAGVVGLVYSSALRMGITLTPLEVRQLLIQSAQDIDVPETYGDSMPEWYPSQPGWDRYFGYGRLNAFKAVSSVQARRIPPEVRLDSPEWFQVIDPSRTPIVTLSGHMAANRASSYTYQVSYAVGLDPLDSAFVSLSSGSRTSAFTGPLATFDLARIPLSQLDPSQNIEPFDVSDTNVTRMDKVNRYTITVRAQVTDASGNKGEVRRTLYVRRDPDLLQGFPLYVGGSLESSTKCVDLNGDGSAEILQGTSDGKVYAIQFNGSALPGWPVSTRTLKTLDTSRAGNHVQALAFRSGAVSTQQGQAIIATVASGDLDADGAPEVVAATYDGEVYAWRATGALLSGFPVSIDPSHSSDAGSSAGNYMEAGFFSSPALGDLDGNGTLEIVVGGMDQWVYVWDNAGKTVPGWPVLAQYAADGTVKRDRIMTSPALGDLTGDGTVEVLVGTNELIDGNKSPTYAIQHDGNLNPTGPFVKGWPVLTAGIYADVLPVVGKGTCSSPILADLDRDGMLEVATATITGYGTRQYPSLFRASGRRYSVLGQRGADWGTYTNTEEPAGLVTISTPAFGDLDQDGDIDIVEPLGGFNALLGLSIPATRVEFNYLLAAWDATTGISLAGFPQQVADMQFFMNPIIADLDDDLLPEAISGNGAFTVDAFNRVGLQPEGWPKFTGQWNIAAPSVGDLDGDGRLEVVQGTRSGWLYAWHTPGRTREEGGIVEWSSFHSDAQSSGRYEPAP